jgi:hypothetical protein
MPSDADLEKLATRILACCSQVSAYGMLFALHRTHDHHMAMSESVKDVILACRDYWNVYQEVHGADQETVQVNINNIVGKA